MTEASNTEQSNDGNDNSAKEVGEPFLELDDMCQEHGMKIHSW